MKSEVKEVKETQVVLTLSPFEASWLKGVMQYPLWGEHPENEDSFNKEMRLMFFRTVDWV